MSWPSWLPANRVAAIAAFLTSLAAGIAGIESALPQNWANGAATVVGVLGAIATALHFMLGSQKYDKLKSQERIAANNTPGPAGVGRDQP